MKMYGHPLMSKQAYLDSHKIGYLDTHTSIHLYILSLILKSFYIIKKTSESTTDEHKSLLTNSNQKVFAITVTKQK